MRCELFLENINSDEQKIIKAVHLLAEEKKYFTKNIKIKPQQQKLNYEKVEKNKSQRL